MRLPHLREVSKALKDRFDGASRVLISNAGSLRDIGRKLKYKFQLKPYNPEHKPPSKKDLVFFEDSPTFCERDRRYGLPGTSGRPCNLSSIGVDGCDLMCCGRGHTVSLQTITTRCNCLFKWCCEVQCQNCTVTRANYNCKWKLTQILDWRGTKSHMKNGLIFPLLDLLPCSLIQVPTFSCVLNILDCWGRNFRLNPLPYWAS